MNLLLFVFAAAVGGFIRFAAEYYLPPVGSSAFPRATWLVNVVGAFLLGIVLALPGDWQVILGIGLCSALTTFSGVSLQLHRRLMAQAFRPAMIYAVTLLTGGIVAAAAGLILGRYIFG
jgi:fluoride exporter